MSTTDSRISEILARRDPKELRRVLEGDDWQWDFDVSRLADFIVSTLIKGYNSPYASQAMQVARESLLHNLDKKPTGDVEHIVLHSEEAGIVKEATLLEPCGACWAFRTQGLGRECGGCP